MDPPRSGSDKPFLSSLIKLAPKKVVYISCGPESLARDLKYLTSKGYQVIKITPFDLFPFTEHTECIVLLSKLHTKQHIEVEIHTDELDLTSAESKTTYAGLKQYVLDKYDLKVSCLNITQIKAKCGIIKRENYNKANNENVKQSNCTEEKEKCNKRRV